MLSAGVVQGAGGWRGFVRIFGAGGATRFEQVIDAETQRAAWVRVREIIDTYLEEHP